GELVPGNTEINVARLSTHHTGTAQAKAEQLLAVASRAASSPSERQACSVAYSWAMYKVPVEVPLNIFHGKASASALTDVGTATVTSATRQNVTCLFMRYL